MDAVMVMGVDMGVDMVMVTVTVTVPVTDMDMDMDMDTVMSGHGGKAGKGGKRWTSLNNPAHKQKRPQCGLF